MTSSSASFARSQSSFFAHRITLAELGEDALAQSLSTAQVNATNILAGLLAKELIAHGDLHRCPVACPYSLSAIASEVVA